MVFDGDKISITKLDDTNYGVWCIKMKRLLIAKNLWQAINAPPVAPADQQLPAQAVQRDDEALTLITLNVSDNLIP